MEPAQSRSKGHETAKQLQGPNNNGDTSPSFKRRSSNGRRRSGQRQKSSDEAILTMQTPGYMEDKAQDIDKPAPPKKGSLPRPVGGHEKLGTFSGVFVPTSLNVLSILMFLRFGFILGQAGVLGTMG